MWKYNIASNEWVWIKGDATLNNFSVYGDKGVTLQTNKVGARYSAAEWMDRDGNLWLSGGTIVTRSGAQGYGSDLWKLSLNVTIPVKLISFTGLLENKIAKLNWVSENELDFSHYQIERSNNGTDFYDLGKVVSKLGNGKKVYSYNDPLEVLMKKSGFVFYRLKIFDKDGKYTYSNIVLLTWDQHQNLIAYPNPTKSNIDFKIDRRIAGPVTIQVINVEGKVVLRQDIQSFTGNVVNLNLSNLPNGLYYVSIKSDSAFYSSQVNVVKQ